LIEVKCDVIMWPGFNWLVLRCNVVLRNFVVSLLVMFVHTSAESVVRKTVSISFVCKECKHLHFGWDLVASSYYKETTTPNVRKLHDTHPFESILFSYCALMCNFATPFCIIRLQNIKYVAQHHPHRTHDLCSGSQDHHPSRTRCRKLYAATRHLMFLMMGVYIRT